MDFTFCPIQIFLQIIILEEYKIFKALFPKEYSKLKEILFFFFKEIHFNLFLAT